MSNRWLRVFVVIGFFWSLRLVDAQPDPCKTPRNLESTCSYTALNGSCTITINWGESSVATNSAEAAQQAADAGALNAKFEVASAKEFPGGDYDLICVFDALHDMGDPVGIARQVRSVLKDDGAFMVVEQIAADRLEDNLTPLAALIYGFSTTICLPVSRSQEVGLCLGAKRGSGGSPKCSARRGLGMSAARPRVNRI